MDIVLWVLLGILGLALLYFLVGLIAAVTMTKVGPHPQYDHTPQDYGLDYQHVHFESRVDGLKLSAWYIPHDGADRAMILVHGRDASKQNAISGKLPELASEIYKAGLAVLILDLRGHGESEGKRYTWGVFERFDVLGVVDFLLEKGFQPGNIGALGISLGGAAVIGAAHVDQAIGAVVLESTFADLSALVEPNWRTESGLPLFFLQGAFLMWQAMYRFDLRKVKPMNELAEMQQRPTLIMHSKSDETIPIIHGRQLAEKVPHAQFVQFENCEHAELFRDDPERYKDVLIAFINEKWGKV